LREELYFTPVASYSMTIGSYRNDDDLGHEAAIRTFIDIGRRPAPGAAIRHVDTLLDPALPPGAHVGLWVGR
jgi:hypothetical protein